MMWDCLCWTGVNPIHENTGSSMYMNDPGTKEVDWLHPFALAAKTASADSTTYREILSLSEDERDKWFTAMEAELKALVEKETFDIIEPSRVPLFPGDSAPHH
jgi:hypothetical protein